MRLIRTLPFLGLGLLVTLPLQAQQTPGTPAERSTLRAERLDGEIRIDGRIEEAAWDLATPATEFTESFPAAGAAPNERTEVRVLYDDQALYVAVRAYDSAPDSIAAPLARRDAAGIYTDWVHVLIDSYHDRRTAFRFSVNPRGVQRDVYVSNDNNEDGSWDAVWQVATQMDSLGWTAEYRIPFSQLRYQDAAPDVERVWGFQVFRDVARREQRFAFSPWNRQSPGFVSRFGELHGLRGVRAMRRMELQPYASSRLTRAPAQHENPFYRANDATAAVGADVKLGITSALTLTATINPDFGQVEVDPAVINLTAFESFFSERRPFFVEGADVFRFGQVRSNINLHGQSFFYSRRIGRTPQRSVGGADVTYIDAPQETAILGAAKVTGKTGPWTIGVMDALTRRENAVFTNPAGEFVTTPVEPRTNYFLSRVRRDFRAGRSAAGAMFSSTHRDLGEDVFQPLLRGEAYFGGVDFDHSWANRVWNLSGYIAGSRVEGSAEAIARTQRASSRYFQRPDADHLTYDPTRTSLQGHMAEIALQRQGNWDFSLGYKESSPGFELNDLGFHSFTDYRYATLMFGKRWNQPTRTFRDRSVYSFGANQWNYGGDRTLTLLGGGMNGTLRNLWAGGFEGWFQPEGLDDRLTRGGPIASRPTEWQIGSWFASPARNRVSFNGNLRSTGTVEGDRNASYSLWADWRPTTAVRVQVGPNYSRRSAGAQFITSAPDPDATETFGRRYIFGEIDQTTVSMTTRLDWTFAPNLSLQLYAQPFVAAGQFDRIKEFREPRTFDFDVYGEDRGTVCRFDGGYVISPTARLECPAARQPAGDPNFNVRFGNQDFNVRSLRGNAVLRWEYRPGSALFVVWQQHRSGFLPTGDFDLTRDIEGVFRQPATNVFMVKATYWFGR